MKNCEICFDKVSFSYENEKIFDSVSFCISEGETVAIIGPNGGGKSTIVKLLLGLLTPQNGKILIDEKFPQNARKIIGYMPQYSTFENIFPITVLEVVLMGLLEKKSFGWYSQKEKKMAEDILEKVNLSNFKNRQFSELSGGQRQRVLIARALVSQPKILILDEPTNNVDPAIEQELYALLNNLQKNMTIITVSHDLNFVMGNVKKVICVNRDVHVHPVSAIDANILEKLYSSSSKLIRHDNCLGHNHTCNHTNKLGGE